MQLCSFAWIEIGLLGSLDHNSQFMVRGSWLASCQWLWFVGWDSPYFWIICVDVASHFNLQEDPDWDSNPLMSWLITIIKDLSQLQWCQLRKFCFSDPIYHEPNPQMELNTEPKSCRSFDIATQREQSCSSNQYD